MNDEHDGGRAGTGRITAGLAAIALGTAAMVWRAGWTLRGVPGWLAYPALVIEVVGLLALVVLVASLLRRSPSATRSPSGTAAEAIDVVIRLDGQSLGHLHATLAGARHLPNVASITVVCDERNDVARAALAGTTVYFVDADPADTTGLGAARTIGSARFIAVFDAGDVPMPGFVPALLSRFDGDDVALVQGRLAAGTLDSAEHDARGRHELRFERETLNPALGNGGGAVWAGSGAVVRRSAIEAVPVPAAARRAAELRWSIRLRASGLALVATTEAVVSAAAVNTDRAVLAERRRQVHASASTLRSGDSPLWKRHLTLRNRFGYLATMVKPLSGVRRAAFIAIVAASIASGRLPLAGSVLGVTALWVPAFLAQGLAMRQLSFGTLAPGDRVRWSMRTMGAGLAGLFGPGRSRIGTSIGAARRGGLVGALRNSFLVTTLVAMAVVTILAGLGRWIDVLPSLPTVERAGILAVAIWLIGGMLDVMHCLAGSGQLRGSSRLSVDLAAMVDGTPADLADVSPNGAAVRLPGEMTLVPDSEVSVRFVVPARTATTFEVMTLGVVRNVRPTSTGTVFGVEFTQMDRASADALYEYCEVIHPAQLAAVSSDGARHGVVARPAFSAAPQGRGMGVRLIGAIAMLGVSLATAPPYGLSAAAPLAEVTKETKAITVQVFQDYNANGTRDTKGDTANPAIDTLVAGATLTATCLTGSGPDGKSGTGDGETYAAPVFPSSASAGTYTFTELEGSPCRIEAVALPAGYEPGPLGTDNAGLVQFASAGATVKIGINRPEEFCQNNPTLVTSCMVFGDQVKGGGSSVGIVKAFPYDASGSKWGGPTPTATPTTLATAKQVGTVFGTAFDTLNRRVYVAAYTKIYAGYGPSGAGAIYEIDPTNVAAPVLFATIPNAGSVPLRDGFKASGDTVSGDWLKDGQNADAVGKVALGDLEMSPDGSTLWAVNLNDRQLYPVDTTTKVVGSPVAIPLASKAATTCAAPSVRPFGLGSNGVRLLVGEVCTGPTNKDLRTYVYAFDPTTGTFGDAPVFETPLTYTHGKPGNSCGPNGGSGNWNAWATTNLFDGSGSTSYCAYPQPMLTDLEIDDDGSLILGFRDRFGDQAGEDVPQGKNGGGGEGVAAGDLLRACVKGSGWEIEANGSCGSVAGSGVKDAEGPGGGEFYSDSFPGSTGGGGTHAEISTGGLAKVPGFGTTVWTAFDPSTENGNDWRAGGIRRTSNTTGSVTGFFELFDKCDSSGISCASGQNQILTFGKVNGLGDVVAFCDRAPIEIGDRVWYDSDGNGTQDPGESPIPGVVVTLTVGKEIWKATTDAAGNYRFSSDTRFKATKNAIYGIAPMKAGTAVTLTFPTTATIDGGSYGLTRQDSLLGSGASDANDSDPPSTGVLDLKLGTAGQNDHTYDAGYAPVYSLGNRVWDDADNSGTWDKPETGIDGVTVTLFADADDNGIPDGVALQTQTTTDDGYYLFTGLLSGTYLVEVATPKGYRSSTGANGMSVGPYEGPGTPDPDKVPTDGDDNGSATSVEGTTVRSKPVVIGPGQPTGEPATPGHEDASVDSASNLTVDFGFFRPVSLGNLVWLDADNDGLVGKGEPGIPGVPVRLLQDGAIVATTVTDGNGLYLFTWLSPGDYVVEVTTPKGMFSSTGGTTEPAGDPDDDMDGNDDGTAVKDDVVSLPVTLVVSKEPVDDDDQVPSGANDPAGDDSANATVDFGFWKPVSVGNLVWGDLDDNGRFDGDEVGIAKITVSLFGADKVEVPVGPDGVLGTEDDADGGMVTDDKGNYVFSNLPPGSYHVSIGVPAGSRTSSTASDDANDDTDDDNNGGVRQTTTASADVTLSVDGEPTTDGDVDASSNLTVDFGIFTPQPAMTLKKYTNGCDAQKATGADGPTGSCSSEFDPNPNPVVAASANITWTYVATNTGNVPLSAAEVTDDLIEQDLIDCNGRAEGTGQPFTLAVGASTTCTASGIAIGGQYGNVGTLNATGEGDPGVEPKPLDPQTDPSHYFGGEPGLATKKYTVLADPGAATDGILDGASPTVDGVDDADVAGGADTKANHVIGDGTTVWWLYSVTNSGNVQLDDVQIVDDHLDSTGVPIVVCQGLTLAPTETRWCVRPGVVSLADTDGGQYENIGTATGVDKTTDPENPATVGPVSDPSHVYIPTVAISLKKYTNGEDADTAETRPSIPVGSKVIWTYVVTNTGDWPLSAIDVVDDLEGAITCPALDAETAVLAPGESITCTATGVAAAQKGGADYVNNATVTGTPVPPESGTLTKPTDADPSGYRPIVASIGDYVWLDADVDGVQDEGEVPVADVEVHLLDADGAVLATTTTDASGHYSFVDLGPGTYSIEFAVPAGYVVTGIDAGTDDAVDSDVDPTTMRTEATELSAGEDDDTWDLGLYQSAGLGDFVWSDLDRDGVQDENEPAVAGVAVTLFDATGGIVSTTSTDELGHYEFLGLVPGDYVVQFTVPSGWVVTAQDAGTDDARDSDIDAATGQTAVISLSSGEYDPTNDAGIYQLASLGDHVFRDLDSNGIQNPGEPGVAGVTVILRDGTGGIVSTTSTDENGDYAFTGLEPGAYSVIFTSLPLGLVFTTADQGDDDAIDSDADPTTGATVLTTLEPGENDVTWDAGLVVVVEQEPPPPPTTVLNNEPTTTTPVATTVLDSGPRTTVPTPDVTTPPTVSVPSATNVPIEVVTPDVQTQSAGPLPTDSSVLPSTGADVFQLLVFGGSLTMLGLVFITARRRTSRR